MIDDDDVWVCTSPNMRRKGGKLVIRYLEATILTNKDFAARKILDLESFLDKKEPTCSLQSAVRNCCIRGDTCRDDTVSSFLVQYDRSMFSTITRTWYHGREEFCDDFSDSSWPTVGRSFFYLVMIKMLGLPRI